MLTPNWVNMDGSVPPQFIRYHAGATSFLLTGSVAQFEANFGASQGAVSLTHRASFRPALTRFTLGPHFRSQRHLKSWLSL